MSNAPFLIPNVMLLNIIQARKGFGYGDQKMYDCIAWDGLTDAYNKISMGLCA